MRCEIEFTDASDPRGKDAWGEKLEFEDSKEVPTVPVSGDFVYVYGKLLKAERRMVSVFGDTFHFQVFCREASEPEVFQGKGLQ